MSDHFSSPPFDSGSVAREAMAAEYRIRPGVRVTPLVESVALGKVGKCRCFLKLENEQVTGSFKTRGAMAFLTGVPGRVLNPGVVTASTGNHGMAVAWGGRNMGVAVRVVVPENASPLKTRRLEAMGAKLSVHGQDVVEAESFARTLAESRGLTYVSPYNHPLVIAGQAGIAMEVEKKLGFPDHFLVPVGGGGLAGGIAGWCAARNATTRIVGCQPANSCVMANSVRAGRIILASSRPTLAAAAAGGIEAGSLTFPLCRDHISSWELLAEKQIREAMDLLLEVEGIRAEGAAALPVAAFMRDPGRFSGSLVVLIISGGNVDSGEAE